MSSPTLARHLPPPLLVLQQRVLMFVILPPLHPRVSDAIGPEWENKYDAAGLVKHRCGKRKNTQGLAAGLISGISGAQRCGKVKREQHQLLIPIGEEFPVPLTVLHVACSRSNLEKTNIQLSLRGRMCCVLMCVTACLDFWVAGVFLKWENLIGEDLQSDFQLWVKTNSYLFTWLTTVSLGVGDLAFHYWGVCSDVLHTNSMTGTDRLYQLLGHLRHCVK